MKRLIAILVLFTAIYSCGDNKSYDTDGSSNKPVSTDPPKSGEATATNENPSYDPHRGEGKFKEVAIGASLDATKAEAGNKIYAVKCGGC
ncbi:MAG: hypothetical protein ABIY51_03045, partial [Ferruginibacter sp.]